VELRPQGDFLSEGMTVDLLNGIVQAELRAYPHSEQMRYTFARDAEGYLSTYTEEQIYGFLAGRTPPREYRVRGKFR
jgi:hypothetical protein